MLENNVPCLYLCSKVYTYTSLYIHDYIWSWFNILAEGFTSQCQCPGPCLWIILTIFLLFNEVHLLVNWLGNVFSRGQKIIREGVDYYLVHLGEVHRHLGSRPQSKGANGCLLGSEIGLKEEPSSRILDEILFFLGDLEAASVCGKRKREVWTILGQALFVYGLILSVGLYVFICIVVRCDNDGSGIYSDSIGIGIAYSFRVVIFIVICYTSSLRKWMTICLLQGRVSFNCLHPRDLNQNARESTKETTASNKDLGHIFALCSCSQSSFCA